MSKSPAWRSNNDHVATPRLLSFAIALSMAASVPAGAARAQTPSGALTLEEITVRGQRLGQQRAVEHKRNAANIVDALAADDIGRLPDRNIGDALSRLPGVSTDQFEGEARFVNIRGLDASLNNLTLDGTQIGTGDDRGRDGRSAALDGISTSGIATIEVVKTPTPDMDGVGIGGTINLITPSAFDRPPGAFGFSIDSSQSNVSDTSAFDWLNAEAFGSTVFGAEEQFGLFLSADYLRRNRLVRDRADNVRWSGGDPDLPTRADLTRFPIKRDRINASGNFEWRAAPNTQLYLRGRYTLDERNIDDRSVEQINVRGAPTGTTGDAIDLPLRITLDGWTRRQENTTYSFTAGGETDVDNLTLAYSLAYARAISDRPVWNQIRFQTGNFPGQLFLENRVRFESADPAFRQDPANFRLQRIRFDSIETKENLLAPKLDVTWNTPLFGFDGMIKTGLKATLRDKSVDARSDRFTPIDTLTLADFDFAQPGPGQPGYPHGGSWFQGSYISGPAVDSRAVLAHFEANRDRYNFLETQSITNNIEDDFDTDEDVYAGYVMGRIDTGRTLWTAGLRVEHTDYVSRASRATIVDGELTSIDPVRGSSSYTDFLFNLQLRHQIQDNLVLRAAFTQSIGRPDFVAAAPIEEFEVEQVGIDGGGNPILIGFLDAGNPDLDRFQSDNFDLSLEYYPSDTGLFAIALFWKEIDNPIFNRREFISDTSFAGVELETLRIDTFENADSGRVRGVELTAQEQFRFLPSPLDNFGMSANYTIVDSKSDVLERDDNLPFFGQADRIANIALFYQQEGFEARLAWRHRDETLESLGGNPTQDIYRDSYSQLDFKTSYRFGNGVRLFADVWNLTNKQPRIFQGDSSRFWGLEDTGRIYTVGLQWANF